MVTGVFGRGCLMMDTESQACTSACVIEQGSRRNDLEEHELSEVKDEALCRWTETHRTNPHTQHRQLYQEYLDAKHPQPPNHQLIKVAIRA